MKKVMLVTGGSSGIGASVCQMANDYQVILCYNSGYDRALKIIAENNILTEDGVIILEHPIKKEINLNGYKITKTKEYGNKQITYLTK